MKHARINNIPNNPKNIYDDALKLSFNYWIDEKGTKKHPKIFQRKLSDLTYEEAFEIIQNNKPHWVISFRNISYITNNKEKDYWEFGGCNIKSNDYGDVFIWIQVKIEDAIKIFEKYKLIIDKY